MNEQIPVHHPVWETRLPSDQRSLSTMSRPFPTRTCSPPVHQFSDFDAQTSAGRKTHEAWYLAGDPCWPSMVKMTGTGLERR